MCSGAAYVFITSDSGETWSQQQKLLPFGGPDNDDEFGISVAIHGDILVVGANWADTSNGGYTGAAFIFTASNGLTWTAQQRLEGSDGGNEDHFRTVDVYNTTIAVGAFGNDNENGNSAGKVDCMHKFRVRVRVI